MNKRKVCVVLVDRANYGRLWPVMKAIEKHPLLELNTIIAGTMVLKRFGSTETLVKNDGFEIHGRVYMELEGSIPTTMAKSLGFGIIEFSSELQRLQPDVLLVIGDRYEALSAVIAAAYQNIFIAHIQGGEISGSIDESARHAITKFSHLHFPATSRSAEYLVRMGEDPDYVYNYGCPCGDYIKTLSTDLPGGVLNDTGLGVSIDVNRPFLLVIFHPVTTAFGKEFGYAEELLIALNKIKHPTVWLWPNIDAGADHISIILKRFLKKENNTWLRLIKNFNPVLFQKILKKCACAIGNSSSFIRDTTFSGTPVVLVGDRQDGREYGENLLNVPYDAQSIEEGVKTQLAVGRTAPSKLYGEGDASELIVEKLANVEFYYQKRLAYFKEAPTNEL